MSAADGTVARERLLAVALETVARIQDKKLLLETEQSVKESEVREEESTVALLARWRGEQEVAGDWLRRNWTGRASLMREVFSDEGNRRWSCRQWS
ncbi:hypothetical protein M5K25_007573 [Dendrobium thyrsiflorum]|uniref:Uncharacterized protein n=1 Tax=Dendrobium thyrsiflorum TaxID=117978 RepID=A0ABD0VFJ0_DENTH